MRGRWRAGVALAALGGAVLTGCTARTEVDVTVRSAQSADVVISAQFTDEAAGVLHSQPDVLKELVATFTDRTGTEPKVTNKEDLVEVSATVDYDHLTASGAITGVGQVALAEVSEGEVRASVELRDAPDLVAAVTAATATQPDAGAVYETMAKGTSLVLRVTFPGGLSGEPQLVGVAASAMNVDGGTVTVVRTLSEAGQGAVVVAGDPNDPLPWLWFGVGGAVLVLGTIAVVAHRRDQADPQTARRY